MDIGQKIVNLAAGALAGVAANIIIDAVWEAGFGKVSPRKLEEDELDIKELVVFAVVSGAVTTLLQALTARKAANMYKPVENTTES